MRIVGAAAVEDALATGAGRLVVGPRDLVTPLARERAGELGVLIDVQPDPKDGRDPLSGNGSASSGATQPDVARARELELGAAPATDPGPPSGALFRRGGPIPAALALPGVRTVPATPSVPSLSGTPFSAADGRVPGARARRVVVVGAGHVGMITALRLAESHAVDEVVLTDLVEGLAAGIALDLTHTSALSGFRTRLRGVATIEQAGPAEYYVLTAGRPRTPGMSRTDLASTNATIVDALCRDIARTSPEAVVVVVTNPLDEMTQLAWRSTGFAPGRVLGMAGVLDVARFRALTALAGPGATEEVEAIALGSRGDEMVIPLSQARISGRPMTHTLPPGTAEALVERARGSGAEVVGLLGTGSAFLAPGTSAAHMVLAMIRDDGTLLPATVLAGGAYGLGEVFVGLPVRLGRAGVREVVELPLDAAERAALQRAAQRVRARVDALGAQVAVG